MLEFNLTLWIQMALFLVFAGLMNAVFFRPVTKVLEERRAYVAGKHEQAKADLKAIQNLQEDYEARLKAARLEAQEAVSTAVGEAERKRQASMAAVKDEVEKQIAGARDAIRAERDQALSSLSGDVSQLAAQIARKVGVEPAVVSGGAEA
ncbi:MAG TPA: hypothetical protein V6D00_06435 [Pantanalinema sp.]